jgi:hypothetical protein
MNGEKRLLGKPTRSSVDNIKIDQIEIGLSVMDWTDVAQDRNQWRTLVNTVVNIRVPQNVGKFLSSCTTGGFSRRAQLQEIKLVWVVLVKINKKYQCRSFFLSGAEIQGLHLPSTQF